jgi:SAM-dependent methyltransferase
MADEEKKALRLDIGCGPSKAEGFFGIDKIEFPGVDLVFDAAGSERWPFEDGSVEFARSSHFIEHLTALERVAFMNELWRVLKPKAQCQIVVPHWASCRAYGDPTHQWPPVSESWFYYLLKSWRMENAPHTDVSNLTGGFACDFDAVWGYSMVQDLSLRDAAYQQFAFTNYKESIQDIIATLTKR